MHLIHRNRVIETRAARFCFRCGLICLQISSHSGEGLFRLPLSTKTSKTDTIIAFTVMVNLTKRMRAESLTPLWEDICKQIRSQRRDISRNVREMIDAVAVDEVHHADALSHLRKCKRANSMMQLS